MYKNPPYKRITLSIHEIQNLSHEISTGKKLKDIAKSFGWSDSKLMQQKKLLGISKPSDSFDNKKVTLQLSIPRKHYNSALKRFNEIIKNDYKVTDKNI